MNTAGWVNYANESSQAALERSSQAVLERSSQDAYNVIRLTRSKAAVWTVARLIEIFLKNFYLFLPSVAYDPEGKTFRV